MIGAGDSRTSRSPRRPIVTSRPPSCQPNPDLHLAAGSGPFDPHPSAALPRSPPWTSAPVISPPAMAPISPVR